MYRLREARTNAKMKQKEYTSTLAKNARNSCAGAVCKVFVYRQ